MSQNIFQIELEAVLNTLVDGVIIIDDKGLMQLFNPACERIFGYLPKDVIGQNVKMLMPEPYHSKHDGYLESYNTTQKKKIIGIGREVKGRRKDGSVFHMDLAVGEAKTEGKAIFVGIIRDLSEQFEQREKYETLQQEHFHLSRVSAMNEMGTAIAHELNQPMTATINYLEAGKFMIDQGQIDDSANLKNILDSAIDQTKRASEIIARLRKFIETGDMQKEEVDLKLSLETAIDMALLPFKQSAIDVITEISTDLPLISINQVQVQQVVVNLIKNACEAMQDCPNKKLLISAYVSDNKGLVEICIADSGTGITEADQKSLFSPFSTQKQGGMGVGLSISRSIIENHDGHIWAEANQPEGTRFYFTLPINNSGATA